ncbi:choline/ethanolamine kinase [Nitzschia inconspicua]|uniref:Choline/ethanolamine kinase n=1 Tax=Nitzschia inconspicua TaxID=303405 RepID=A0A9K3LLK6_9STRA|nr:choline/ethanolamine kinase [Nitzschia inconspicua]
MTMARTLTTTTHNTTTQLSTSTKTTTSNHHHHHHHLALKSSNVVDKTTQNSTVNDNNNNNNHKLDNHTIEYQYQYQYRNNPYQIAPFSIDTTVSTERLHAQITQVIQVLCPFLIMSENNNTTNPHPPLSIRPLTGGLSNHLFLVSARDTPITTATATAAINTTTVLVRIHPDSACGHNESSQNDDGSSSSSSSSSSDSSSSSFSIVNRELENRFAVWLATQKTSTSGCSSNNSNNNNSLAPTVFGRFRNGRIEEFYDNVRPLSCPEMKRYAPYIAPQMAAFHLLPDPSSDILPRPKQETATVYQTIETWLKQAQELFLLPDDPTHDTEQQHNMVQRLGEEWTWLKEQLSNPPVLLCNDVSPIQQAGRQFIRRIAITHMDCQPLNILIPNNNHPDTSWCSDSNNNNNSSSSSTSSSSTNGSNETKDAKVDFLRLIDFEYSGWNPVAADIANTFCEYCEMSNLKADYEAEYPSNDQQDEFFWYYCSAYPVDDDHPQFAMIPRNRNTDAWKEFSQSLQQEVGRFSLLSHLGWAIWSVVKSNEKDGVDFDYLVYANHRMEGYDWAKQKFFSFGVKNNNNNNNNNVTEKQTSPTDVLGSSSS